jgi:prevent-host-death family protein
MSSIKPVSDLRNYNEVLRDVAEGQPVFLTKNGRGKYVILDLGEYEKTQASMQLLSELAKGEQSAKELGWLSSEDVKTLWRSDGYITG